MAYPTDEAVAVVIPYFQRERGILRRAILSVLGQEGIDACEIVIVDDGSPVRASEELVNLDTGKHTVRIVEQANAGPGAARNTGLDCLDGSVRYVAFLDSDDEWSPDHLRNAMLALNDGHDVYFADLTHLGQSVGAFVRAGRIQPEHHPPIGTTTHLRSYRGDMLSQVVTGNVIGTPTVVFDRSRFPEVRFRSDLRNAGEDYLFWMTLARAGARFAFSTNIEARCGKGVNVYSGSVWGTEPYLLRLINELKYRKTSRREFSLAPHAEELVRAKERALRAAIMDDLLHRLRHLRSPRLKTIRTLVATDPIYPMLALPLAARAMVRRRR